MRIAVDAMGGDYAPEEIVKGAVQAAKELGVAIALVGNREQLERELHKYDFNKQQISIVPASEVITMGEHPASAVRKKADSSIMVATDLVKKGEAQAVVSAGNTGAAMAAAKLRLRSIPGIERPAIATVIPTERGKCLLLDVGANADCKPNHLLHFALMGSTYVEKIWGITQPKVGLLNIGEEETKGNELSIATYELLKQSNLNFVGNAEGRDITKGDIDVIVCDGFVGNVVLKFGEGLAGSIFQLIKGEIKRNWLASLGVVFLVPVLKALKKKMDYTEYGGAPLLGVNGVSIISHGSSKEKAIKNAIRVAKEVVEGQVVENICQGVAKLGVSEG